MTSFDQEEYNAAKTKFEEALGLFTELEDEEKIAECREQIASCDEALETTQISPMMILLLLTVVIVGAVIGAVYLRTRRPVTEKPPGPKPARPVKPAKPAETDALKMLQARLARGEITKEEYERIKSVIEEE
ncbi:MAG: SHOCT domain-containing protein [Theionarchaea archaeon]|nr:SHOCT domain-containing protein [Theionarchaea archaeon]